MNEPIPYDPAMRKIYLNFDTDYTHLIPGSSGTYPTPVEQRLDSLGTVEWYWDWWQCWIEHKPEFRWMKKTAFNSTLHKKSN